ncbi:MAG: hypothetical protein PHI83_08615 [Sphaerochaetaceae bacterium]|nr:hypothetical protein [Sphaerochaetaceae bacterium]
MSIAAFDRGRAQFLVIYIGHQKSPSSPTMERHIMKRTIFFKTRALSGLRAVFIATAYFQAKALRLGR